MVGALRSAGVRRRYDWPRRVEGGTGVIG
jgi:hypothetical protein